MSPTGFRGVRAIARRGIAMALVLAGGGAGAHAQTILYVNTSEPVGANSGTSWEDAFRGPDALQLALDAALPIVSGGGTAEVWVAKGTYVPTDAVVPGEPASVTFGLESGMRLYGGFAGGETSLDQRDPAGNPTILSGNFTEGRAWHVVTVSDEDGECILDGFTVTEGFAWPMPGSPNFPGGAGLLISGSPTIANCTIKGNSAAFDPVFGLGGGAHCAGGITEFIDCTFSGNSASADGGALWGAATVLRSTFIDNAAQFAGGAIAGNAELDACEFEANEADGGGAIYGGFTVVSSRFRSNVARFGGTGGGAFVTAASSFTGCEFDANEGGFAPAVGGPASLFGCRVSGHSASAYHIASAEISGCIFSGNTGAFASGTEPLVNCVFVGNNGSVEAIDGSSFINCTWLNNSSLNGALLVLENASSAVTNCIFWGNTGPRGLESDQILLESGASLALAYSCVEGLTGSLGGVGNFGNDPRLDPDGRPLAASPCIDSGDSTAVPAGTTTDVSGEPRIVDDLGMPDNGPSSVAVDVGAHEFQGKTCYANCDGSELPPLLNVTDFTCYLQSFAAGSPYANCDASTMAPRLNVDDFTCFLQQFVMGCP